MTLHELRNQLSKHCPEYTAVADFKLVLELYINAEPPPDDSQTISDPKEHSNVKMICQTVFRTGPNTLFCTLHRCFFGRV